MKRGIEIIAPLAVAAALALTGCGGGGTPPSTNVWGTLTAPKAPPTGAPTSACTPATLGRDGCIAPAPNTCHARDGGARPDPNCTPGAVNTKYVGTALFCDPAYRTGMDRPPTSYTTPLKLKLLAAYGIPASQVKLYELDHLIPLTAGGAPSDPHNLWPEAWDGPQGAHVKDRAELQLHKTVCTNRSGDVSLVQGAFATDWRAGKVAGPLPAREVQ